MRGELFIYESRKAGSGMTWALFLFFGWSYGSLGEMGKQIAYYVTFGFFGLWTLYILFTLNWKIRDYNRNLAIEVGLTYDEVTKLGL